MHIECKVVFKGICSTQCKKKEKVYDLESTNHSSNSSSVGSWLLALKELSKNSIKRYTAENIFLFTSERKSDMSFTLQ